MGEGDVIVGTFTEPEEAEFACRRLKSEGIPAYVSDDPVASPFGSGRRVVVYVPAADYERASRFLEEHPQRPPESDAEPEEEEDDLWLCPLCGEPLSVKSTVCPGCGTARPPEPAKEEAVVWDRPRRSESKGVTNAAWDPSPLLESDVVVPVLKTAQGDALAARALKVALLSFLCLPVAYWSFRLAFELLCYEGEFSPAGTRNKIIALILNAILLPFAAAVFIGLKFSPRTG
jgi:hypothetical protein